MKKKTYSFVAEINVNGELLRRSGGCGGGDGGGCGAVSGCGGGGGKGAGGVAEMAVMGDLRNVPQHVMSRVYVLCIALGITNINIITLCDCGQLSGRRTGTRQRDDATVVVRGRHVR